jgi:hypothetical protein
VLTVEQTDELVRELEDKLRMAAAHKPAASDLRDARVLLFKLRDAPIQPVVLREKLTTLKNWIEIFFTNPKLERFGGAEKVRGHAIAHCEYLSSLLGTGPFSVVR